MTEIENLQKAVKDLEYESLQLSKVLILGSVLAGVLVTTIVIFTKWGHIKGAKNDSEKQ